MKMFFFLPYLESNTILQGIWIIDRINRKSSGQMSMWISLQLENLFFLNIFIIQQLFFCDIENTKSLPKSQPHKTLNDSASFLYWKLWWKEK